MYAERRQAFALGLVFTAALLGFGGGGAASAQQPEPHFELVPGTASEAGHLTVTVPDGWALYAPDTGTLGLPLTASWILAEGALAGQARGARGRLPAVRASDPPKVRLDGPPGRHESSAAGPVRVYRGRVVLAVSWEGWSIERDLEVRWALCRRELCVPGRTRVPQKIR